MKPCIICGSDFKPYRSASVVCSPKCRNLHHKAVMKDWYWRDPDARRADAQARNAANPQANRDRVRAWRQQNPERVHQISAERYAADREGNRARSRAYYESNRERAIARASQWAADNPNSRRAIVRRYKKTDRGRLMDLSHVHVRLARKRGAPGFATPEQMQARWSYFGGLCWMCGSAAGEWDHVIPLARGGSNWPSNLRPACRKCNTSKGKKKPSELKDSDD